MNTKQKAEATLKQLYGGTTEKLRAEHVERNGDYQWRGIPVPDTPINRQMREERRAAERAAQAAADASIAEYSRRSAEVKAMKDKARQQWLDGGGSAVTFEKKWPELHHQILAQRIVEGGE